LNAFPYENEINYDDLYLQKNKAKDPFKEIYPEVHLFPKAEINIEDIIQTKFDFSKQTRSKERLPNFKQKHYILVVMKRRFINTYLLNAFNKKLKEAGIEVIENVLEKECRELNEIFIKNMSEHKTFVAVKTATTIDGKIAAYNGSSKWITSELARNEVKKLRKIYDAILTSSATVIADNPTMEHNNKIVIDRNLQTDFENANIYKSGQVLVFYDKNIESVHLKSVLRTVENKTNINLLPAETNSDRIDLCSVLDEIYKRGIMSVIVEAGGRLNGSVLRHTDKIYQFMAPKVLGDNKGLSCFDFRTAEDISDAEVFKIADIQKFEPDILITYKK
jgi:diaminohydroxyphosphoribosylaminopyrimidine deaminase/5-amino-6-(5-phosphoribosylamino)uracil reductase